MTSQMDLQTPQEKQLNCIFLKIVIVGESNVGKTTILESLSGSGKIGRGYSIMLEIPIEIKTKTPPIFGRIYDLRSQRYFPYLHSLYYNNSEGAVIVFDVTRRKTFESIEKWRDIIWGHVGNIPLLICGNKSDLRENSVDHVNYKEVVKECKRLSEKYNKPIPYIELSAQQRIIAYSSSHVEKQMEDIYPTVDAFREPFVDWLVQMVKQKTNKKEIECENNKKVEE